VVVDGATVRPILTETTTMIVLGILGSLAVIGLLCWLLFTLAVSCLTGVIFGLVPLLQVSGTDPSRSLREGSRSGDASGRLTLGTWQSICLVDLNVDNAVREVRFSFLRG
jgi:predicted lysophospholipase L1 biosynthesis ABC-type transport system permease subunit